ncbi:hypothetical protein CONLIGDRAFT_644432 [Coniochaeta ligniaria NRRL 30616]|uniref:Concanavalin A-like lectin/glucanase n=1 Tax=Coniochaeta ligniaria NRRL 30616 TaxID=1408157 RepID=A0A1J7JG52_9PEZI|nr:hypothetical protein CONLIGDRAFT_644432 [Coniochaeta ligniaria NRRL 30616]
MTMWSQTFSIAAAPGTDVWRKPPSTDIFNAPTHTPPSAHRTNPLSSFLSARISFSFPFATAAQYDQGGLLLSFRPASGSSAPSAGSAPPPKWIKTGVEYYNSAPRLSTVSCETYADWSVGDRSPDGAAAAEGAGDRVWTTVAVEKQTDHHGPSFWVFRVLEDGTKVPLREITWIYAGGDGEVAKWDVTVEALAARPDTEVTSDLVVEFKDFEVEWAT